MENIYYSSNIEYLFVKKIQQMLDLQYEPMKKEFSLVNFKVFLRI